MRRTRCRIRNGSSERCSAASNKASRGAAEQDAATGRDVRESRIFGLWWVRALLLLGGHGVHANVEHRGRNFPPFGRNILRENHHEKQSPGKASAGVATACRSSRILGCSKNRKPRCGFHVMVDGVCQAPHLEQRNTIHQSQSAAGERVDRFHGRGCLESRELIGLTQSTRQTPPPDSERSPLAAPQRAPCAV